MSDENIRRSVFGTTGQRAAHVPDIPPQEDAAKAPKIGANTTRKFLRILPLTGRGKSKPYPHIGDIDFALDYSELVITWPDCVVTVSGQNLERLLQRIEEERLDCIKQTATDDPFQAAIRDKEAWAVTGIRIEPVEER